VNDLQKFFLGYKVAYQSETLIIDLGLLAESDAWRVARLIFCWAGLVPFGILAIAAIFFFAQCKRFFLDTAFLKIGRAFRISMAIFLVLGKGKNSSERDLEVATRLRKYLSITWLFESFSSVFFLMLFDP